MSISGANLSASFEDWFLVVDKRPEECGPQAQLVLALCPSVPARCAQDDEARKCSSLPTLGEASLHSSTI